MVFKKQLLSVGIVLLISIMACTVGANTPADQDGMSTQVAQTVEAASIGTMTAAAANQAAPTQEEAAQPVEAQATETPTPTSTVASAPSATAAPMVSVSLETNCRYGPGEVYDPPVGFLSPGKEVAVVGMPATPINYILIQNPNGSDVCWLWTKYATITGDTSGLPKYQIPITPTFMPTDTPTPAGPVFTMSYKNVHDCGGVKYATVKINNTGVVTFKSAQIYIRNKTASSDIYGPNISNDPFMDGANDCPPGNGSLASGDGAFIAGPIGAAPPSGDKARFQLTICTGNGGGGDCEVQSVDFTIP